MNTSDTSSPDTRRFRLTWSYGMPSPTLANVDANDVMAYLYDEDIPAVLALEIGGCHTDIEGDTWERIA